MYKYGVCLHWDQRRVETTMTTIPCMWIRRRRLQKASKAYTFWPAGELVLSSFRYFFLLVLLLVASVLRKFYDWELTGDHLQCLADWFAQRNANRSDWCDWQSHSHLPCWEIRPTAKPYLANLIDRVVTSVGALWILLCKPNCKTLSL